MNSVLNALFDIVDERLGKSEMLKRLGYESRVREVIEESENLSARCRFHIVTGTYRCLSICCHYRADGDHLFTFEVFHTMLDESFLLEDWSRPLRDPNSHYPFLLSAYNGDVREKLNQLISYVDTLLDHEEIVKILKGDAWTECASQF